MLKGILTTLFIAACLLVYGGRTASAQIVDDRYPSFGNRMTGNQHVKLKGARKHTRASQAHKRHRYDRTARPKIRIVRTARRASTSLAGVVAPLASKAREIAAACGSRVISSVRHTRIAGTGGRLSLHASGRAIDMQGNPACIYSHLRGWPGGVSIDYDDVDHVHFSYAPGGPEWGIRFNHYRGHRHKRHARRRA